MSFNKFGCIKKFGKVDFINSTASGCINEMLILKSACICNKHAEIFVDFFSQNEIVDLLLIYLM